MPGAMPGLTIAGFLCPANYSFIPKWYLSMNYLTIIHHLDTIVEVATKAYALGGEIFSITAMLWCLNFIANAIGKTYQAGYAFGKFYRQHLHQPLKWILIHLVALLIFLAELAYKAILYVYQHRKQLQNQVGELFCYRTEPFNLSLCIRNQCLFINQQIMSALFGMAVTRLSFIMNAWTLTMPLKTNGKRFAHALLVSSRTV